MAAPARDVWITGTGLVSSLGEGLAAHHAALAEGKAPVLDADSHAPYVVHPLVQLDYDQQIAKKLDQRQMENWQRLGTYAAGLALQSAGLKGDQEKLANTQVIVAAGGGERDIAVDSSVLTGLRTAPDKGRYLNERLMSDLRPTLFLAQLSNLLAGNIAIVHGVIGASRTFMGEESAGVDAMRIAHARVRSGQGATFLVGGALSARPDLILNYAVEGLIAQRPWAPVAKRDDAPGFHLGSVGAFAVVEEANAARARAAKPLARIVHVASDRSRRAPGSVEQTLRGLWAGVAPALRPGRFAVLSCATGCAPATSEELAVIRSLAGDAPVTFLGDLIGHGVEAQFPAATLFAILGLAPHQSLFATNKTIEQVLITSVGQWRGEGVGLIERIGEAEE